MANGDIRQKIVLEGEKEYSSALKEAQRNLKVLRSELKAETAELGKNATEQQKNEVKTRNLQKQIKEQEKVVRTYEKALEEVREKYGDNEEAVAKWEIKLNDARTALANMKTSIDDVGNSFSKIKTGASSSILETNALAESFGRISDAAGGMSSAIENAFTGAIGAIQRAIGSVWSELMDIAAKSDNYLDLASFFGSSATDVQKWDRAMKAAHGDLSSITSMISRLKYGGKSDSVTEWFGISGVNYTNDLEYVEAVLGKMAEEKERMVAAGTWDDAMGDIFGAKKVQEIDSILSDWDEIQRNLKEFDVENGGTGLTEDELQTMSDLYAQVGLLQEKWNAFKESVATKIFGKLALDISSNFQGALDALISFMDAETEEEREKALEDFQKNIEEAFTKIGEAIGAAAEALDEAGGKLQESENSYVQMLGKILSGLSDAMEWITTEGNLEKVLNFFRAIFDLWLIGKGASFVTKIMGVANSIKTVFNTGRRLLDSGLGDTGTDAATEAARGGGKGINTTLKTAIEKGMWAAGDVIASVMTNPLGASTIAAAMLYPIVNRFSDDASTHKSLEEKYGEDYTNLSATEKALVESGATPDSAKTFTQLQKDMGNRNFLDDIADWMDQVARDGEDAVVKFFTPMAEIVKTLTSPGGGSGGSGGGSGGGGGGTPMYEFDLTRMYPGMRLGASSGWWVDNSTPEGETRLGNIMAGLPQNIQNGLRNIKVVMDTQVVGELVAPVVSQQIARNTA